jgi:hypothetical protein
MKKDKSAGEHITDGGTDPAKRGTCWCNPTIETYAKGKKVKVEKPGTSNERTDRSKNHLPG